MPAETGVWVVKMVPALTVSMAVAASRPCSWIRRRIRSRPRNPAWPSLVWNTSGSIPRACRARTPPMPSRISWRRRCSPPPPYRRSVTARSAGPFSSTSESSSSSGARPDLGPPDLGVEHAVGQAHRDQQRLAAAVADQLEGELVGVEGGVGLLLAAVGGQRLAEVARAVEQADPDHGHAEVAGRLEVVAGEHAEAARVLGQDLADAELGGEVGDAGGGVGQGLVPAGLVQVAPARSSSRACWRARKSGSSAACSSTWASISFSIRSGLCPEASQPAGSMARNSSWVAGCQLQRRLWARTRSGLRASGTVGSTVNRCRGLMVERSYKCDPMAGAGGPHRSGRAVTTGQ